ncbi:helix-turn-helix domain-containing protein [Mucilaginibacter sp.]|uniref:helix-turn-helix domain-containing protein n=1 Tax=Mucilaginibacter sp. TaxID=1882438 RepID=UPI003D09F957
MAKKNRVIPVNTIADHFDSGIAFERLNFSKSEETILNSSDEARIAHREDRHSFFLLEKGTVVVEIDFQKFEIKPFSIVYMHPDQVHRVLRFENVTVTSWAINNESLHPEYLRLLESFTPAKPLVLEQETFSLISEAVSLCIKFLKRKNDRLYHSSLKDSCNALISLVISRYLALGKSAESLSRFKLVADAFKSLLESNYISIKSPAAYAQKLNISTPYLNECVKNATGYPVSNHIQQRIILEAKRLLYHSDKSVKEISSQLGYDDYPYFSKLFHKAVGMPPLVFRNKNLD